MIRANKTASIFGEGPYGKATADALKVSATVAPFALLLGYLHRSWGAGASKDLSKSEKVIKSLLTIDPGKLPKKEGGDEDKPVVTRKTEPKSIVLKTMATGGPILTAGAMYLLGIKAADKHRTATLGKKSKKELAAAERAYNKTLHEKLYPQEEQAAIPVEQQEAPFVPFSQYAKAAGDEDKAPATTPVPAEPGPFAKAVATTPVPAEPGPFAKAVATGDKILGWIPGSGAAAVGAGGLAILAYLMGRRWADSNDPNRKRAKEIRSAIEQRATRRWVPKLVIDDPDTQKQLAKEHAERVSL